jgi:16S rRNA processing protein RimM
VTWDDLAVVGRIARPHGIRGQVIVNLETDFPRERFRPGAELFVQRTGRIEPVTITTVRFQHDRPVIGLDGVTDMNGAATLAGLELRVPVSELTALPEGSHYHHDLVGCVIATPAGETIGRVTGVEGSTSGSRLVVETPGGEALIPLAAEYGLVIDTRAKRIVAELPEGLIELNRPGKPRR